MLEVTFAESVDRRMVPDLARIGRRIGACRGRMRSTLLHSVSHDLNVLGRTCSPERYL